MHRVGEREKIDPSNLPSQKTERKKEETESKRMYSGWPTHPSVNLLLKPGGGGELVMAEKIYGN